MKKKTFKGWAVVSNHGNLQFTEAEPLIFTRKKLAEEWLGPVPVWMVEQEDLDKVERVTITVEPIKRKKRIK